MTEERKPKVIFAPGCFDQFEGTQEELDQLIAEITQLAESGALMEEGRELDEDAWNELPEEEQAQLLAAITGMDAPRTLN